MERFASGVGAGKFTNIFFAWNDVDGGDDASVVNAIESEVRDKFELLVILTLEQGGLAEAVMRSDAERGVAIFGGGYMNDKFG